MAVYIERETAIDCLMGILDKPHHAEFLYTDEICGTLNSIPAADVRPVVTCAECDWHVDCGYHFCNKWCLPCPDNADFYCAYGERPTAGLT